jgi:hypothetical protein
VSRKLTILATVVVMPGGLVLLASVLLLVVLARTPRGQRALVAVNRRLPLRLQHPLRRLLALVHREKLFLSGAPPVGPA